jgi:PHP family Zn ribbon phosphoesterase
VWEDVSDGRELGRWDMSEKKNQKRKQRRQREDEKQIKINKLLTPSRQDHDLGACARRCGERQETDAIAQETACGRG